MRGKEPHRVDKNQSQIVKDLKQFGATVVVMSDLGGGCGDILVGWRGRNLLFEIKNPDQFPSAQKLTLKEAEFHQVWKGQIDVVKATDDILDIMRKTVK